MTTNNFKIDAFKLMSGAPIYVPDLQLYIHQPRLYQIAEMGEENFFSFLSYFKINKSLIEKNIKDPMQSAIISNMNEYELILLLIEEQPEIEAGMSVILKLIIKDLKTIRFNPGFLFLNTESGHQYIINNESFLVIKDIIYQIFSLENSGDEYNPLDGAAEKIADKLRERKRKLQESQGKKDQSILSDFVSILVVGLHCLNLNNILNLTVYQIFNIMKRFGMYSQYNIQVQALMQGAEDVELVDWLQTL